MARSILDIVREHPEIRELPNIIPILHHLACRHRIGSWKRGERGFVKRFGPLQEGALLARLAAGDRRYDPYDRAVDRESPPR